MRPLRVLVIYIVVVFLGGALLAPWLYFLAQHFAHVAPKLAASPFHRFVNRAVLGLALAGLWPLLKQLGIASLRDAGLVRPAGQGKNFGRGFLLGLASLAVVAGLSLLGGARAFNPHLSAGQLAGKFFGAALSAAVVAVLEEILFRGALFGALRRVFHWGFALVVTSAIYALVHFLERAELPGPVVWTSGLKLLPLMLGGFVNLHALIPGFLNLTLAGALLALAYQRTGNLYCSIGLHAGWIFWLKSYGAVTVEAPVSASAWWGTAKMVDGWLALPVLVATLVLLHQASGGRTGANA